MKKRGLKAVLVHNTVWGVDLKDAIKRKDNKKRNALIK